MYVGSQQARGRQPCWARGSQKTALLGRSAHVRGRPPCSAAPPTLTMDGTRPRAVTRARSMNWPKGRPSGEPWKMAMVALFSRAAGGGRGRCARQGRGAQHGAGRQETVVAAENSRSKMVAQTHTPLAPGAAHPRANSACHLAAPAYTSHGPIIQPILVGQHSTSPGRTSW